MEEIDSPDESEDTRLQTQRKIKDKKISLQKASSGPRCIVCGKPEKVDDVCVWCKTPLHVDCSVEFKGCIVCSLQCEKRPPTTLEEEEPSGTGTQESTSQPQASQDPPVIQIRESPRLTRSRDSSPSTSSTESNPR